MKSVQIPYDLFIDLAMYHLRGEDDFEEEIRQGLEQKLDAMLNRQLYSRYKTAPTEETQKKERKAKVQALIEEMAPNYGVKAEDLPITDKWLLKSTSQKTIVQEIGEQMKVLVNLYKEREEIKKKCMKSGLAPAPYIEMHENGTSYIDVSNKIESDLIDRENMADRFKQAKQAEVAEQKAAMVDIGDGRLVDENGEVKHELQQVTFTLKGTKEQLDNVARFCITNGVKVVKASERETVIE